MGRQDGRKKRKKFDGGGRPDGRSAGLSGRLSIAYGRQDGCKYCILGKLGYKLHGYGDVAGLEQVFAIDPYDPAAFYAGELTSVFG